MLELVVVGHIMRETIRFPHKEVGPVLGGPAAYSSVAASVLGVRTGIVTIVGEDAPAFVFAPLMQAKVDITGVTTKLCKTRSTVLTYDNLGRKSVFYEDAPGPILVDDIPADYQAVPTYLVCPIDFEVPLDTLDKIRQHASTLMGDLGGFGGAVSPRHPVPNDALTALAVREIVSRLDIVKASLEDCTFLFPLGGSPSSWARTFVNWGARVGIITLGDRGSLIWDGTHEHRISALQVSAVDATGAGDVYCAAFIKEHINGRATREAGLYASAAAAVLAERSGGTTVERMPKDSVVRTRLRELE